MKTNDTYTEVLLWTLRHYHAIMEIAPGEWARTSQTTDVVAAMDADLERIARSVGVNTHTT